MRRWAVIDQNGHPRAEFADWLSRTHDQTHFDIDGNISKRTEPVNVVSD